MESSAGVGLLFIVRMVRRTEMRTEKAAPRTRSGEPTGLNVVAPLPLEHRPHEQRETQHRSNETHEGNQEPDPEQRIHERTRSLQRRLHLPAIPLPALRELVLGVGRSVIVAALSARSHAPAGLVLRASYDPSPDAQHPQDTPPWSLSCPR